MPKALTAKSIDGFKPNPLKRTEIPDGLLTGLYLVIQPSGSRSWAVRYRHNGAPRKLTLGAYPMLSLAEAREAAQDALRAVSKGADPAALKVAKRRAAVDGVDRDLFKNVVAEFLERHVKANKSRAEVDRMFKHDVLPKWGERQIQNITRRDVNELMDGLVDRGVGPMANRVFSIIRKLFNWAIGRDIISVSPCAGVRPPVDEVSRDRVLSDDEIRWFWLAATKAGAPFGPLFKMLLLTGQRLSEVGDMVRSEIRNDLWTIPKERVKNGAAHDVPLSEAALAVLASVPRIKGKAGYVFTTTGDTPVSGFSRAKANLDKAMLAIAREEVGEDAAIPAWRLHDLRRTAASGMARLGINLPVIEKVLNHTSGSFAGIVGVYQRHSFADEKRNALEAWARFVGSLNDNQSTRNVVELRPVLAQ